MDKYLFDFHVFPGGQCVISNSADKISKNDVMERYEEMNMTQQQINDREEILSDINKLVREYNHNSKNFIRTDYWTDPDYIKICTRFYSQLINKTYAHAKCFRFVSSEEFKNNSMALFIKGYFYELGMYVKKDHLIAHTLYNASLEQDYKNSHSINSLGRCYNFGIGVKKDPAQSFKLYTEAYELGNIFSLMNLGNCYHLGINVNIDIQKAFELYKQSYELGNELCTYNLATCYEEKYDGASLNNMELAIKYYHQSAAINNEYALLKLANIYANGIYVIKDLKYSYTLYKQAVNLGSVLAARQLGEWFRTGLLVNPKGLHLDDSSGTPIVEQNYYEAFKYYRYCYQKTADVEIGKILDDIIDKDKSVLFKMRREQEELPGPKFMTL